MARQRSNTTVHGRPHALSSAFLWLPLLSTLLLLLLFPKPASTDCECGYATVVDGTRHVFTDLLETDFARLRDVAPDTDWAAQAFNLSAGRARGEFGEMFAADNVVAGCGEGVRLAVGSRTVEGMVPVAEMDSHRRDLLWGTFRASMKLTDVPGTCAAFFWVGYFPSPVAPPCNGRYVMW